MKYESFEEVKKLMREYAEAENMILDIQEEIKGLKIAEQSLREINAVQYSGMPKGTGSSDRTAEHVCKIIDLYENRILNELLPRIKSIQKKKDMVYLMLQDLDENERKVMEERYVKKTKWDFIPGRINYSRRQCLRFHNSGMEKLCKAYERRN